MKNHWMSSMSHGNRLGLFFAFTLIGLGFGALLFGATAFALLPPGTDITAFAAHPDPAYHEAVKWSNTAMLVGFFLFPVLVLRLLFGAFPTHPLNWTNINRWWWIAPLALVLLSGCVDLLGNLNQWISAQLQVATLDQMQDSANELQKMMLNPETGPQWLSSIVAVIVAPAIIEELYFRGTLIPLLQRVGLKQHAAIWLSACLFSAIHFQFEGFLPRLFLGAMMGYFFCHSRSITAVILAHAVNNAMALILFVCTGRLDVEFTDSVPLQVILPLLFAAMGVGLMYWANKRSNAPKISTDQ